ncbi:hypothetical protein SBV1_1710001 [Verrucomicrobia bacterium]|nr:hypothetical protein SBV1_1710001 [Verrucomicrobiota bacterium]
MSVELNVQRSRPPHDPVTSFPFPPLTDECCGARFFGLFEFFAVKLIPLTFLCLLLWRIPLASD